MVNTFLAVMVVIAALVGWLWWRSRSYRNAMIRKSDEIAARYDGEQLVALYNYGLMDLHTAAYMQNRGELGPPPVSPYRLLELVVGFWVRKEQLSGNPAPERRDIRVPLFRAIQKVLGDKDYALVKCMHLFTDHGERAPNVSDEWVEEEWIRIKREYDEI